MEYFIKHVRSKEYICYFLIQIFSHFKMGIFHVLVEYQYKLSFYLEENNANSSTFCSPKFIHLYNLTSTKFKYRFSPLQNHVFVGDIYYKIKIVPCTFLTSTVTTTTSFMPRLWLIYTKSSVSCESRGKQVSSPPVFHRKCA